MSAAPLVSVCVPTYNGAEFLDACLDSVLGQELSDIEVLIGDDRSIDDTLAIARRRSDPRLRILPFHERAGMARNWSRTLLEARGKYVALVAQDDLLAPAWGVRLAGLLEDHPEASFAFGHRAFGMTDERSRAIVGHFFESSYPAQLERFYARIGTVVSPATMVEMAMEHRFELNLTGEPSFNLLRRDHAAIREGYHSELRQMLDWEFATRFFADAPILHCPEVLGTYRIHVAGSTVGNSALTTQYGDYARLIDLVLQRFAGLLSRTHVEALRAVRLEREQMLLGHARNLAVHAEALEKEREELRAETRELTAHARTLETERDELLVNVRHLEQTVRRIRSQPVYRALCKIKDVFSARRLDG
ncbi:MAG TPA: glycosyltransferase [Planctomycetota bacterium]|nr:glycosyltransferase [Planctomycetota bacterium]